VLLLLCCVVVVLCCCCVVLLLLCCVVVVVLCCCCVVVVLLLCCCCVVVVLLLLLLCRFVVVAVSCCCCCCVVLLSCRELPRNSWARGFSTQISYLRSPLFTCLMPFLFVHSAIFVIWHLWFRWPELWLWFTDRQVSLEHLGPEWKVATQRELRHCKFYRHAGLYARW